LNGPNLDVLARRDPKLYGGLSPNELGSRIYRWGRELRVAAPGRPTNNGGGLLEGVHHPDDHPGAGLLNPRAGGHYSWAISDALRLLEVQIVEVPLSDIENREEWRRFSVVTELAAHRVIGKGPDGYREALEWLAGKERT